MSQSAMTEQKKTSSVAPPGHWHGGALGAPSGARYTEIRVKGPAPTVLLQAAWAEAYHKIRPDVFVNCSDGVGPTFLRALENGHADIVFSFTPLK